MFNNMKYLILPISLISCAWAAELVPPTSAAEEIVNGHANSAGFISAAAIADHESVSVIASATAVSKIAAKGIEDPLRSEYATLDTVYGRVITLGSFCLTKGQINAYFEPTSPWMKTKKGHADLFDWLWIPDYRKFAQALENHLEDFFERKDFDIIISTQTPNIEIGNRKYEMFWNHLFETYTGTYNERNRTIDKLTEEILDREFPSIYEKINYLKKKFIGAKQHSTLYIITGKIGGVELDLDTLLQVRNALTTIRDGNKHFCLLYVSENPLCENTENIIVRTAKSLGPRWNQADPVRWREILDEFKFTPDIWA